MRDQATSVAVAGRPTAVRSQRMRAITLLRDHALTMVAIALVAAVAIGNPTFLSFLNVANMLSQWAPAGLMAIGMTYVIIAGGFDLSLAAGFSFCAVV